jgi:uncharacterized protein YecA (UPF0149 family)
VEDAAPSGPRTIAEQLNDVRDQVAELNAGTFQSLDGRGLSVAGEHMTNGELVRARNDKEIVGRLTIVEDRVNANDDLMAQSSEFMHRVSQDVADNRRRLEEARQSVTTLSGQVHAMQQSQCNSMFGASLADLCKRLKEEPNWFEVMDEVDLENLEDGLEQMQETCRNAAEEIVIALQQQLLSVHEGEDLLKPKHGLLKAKVSEAYPSDGMRGLMEQSLSDAARSGQLREMLSDMFPPASNPERGCEDITSQ